jgi:hypothetical protein
VGGGKGSNTTKSTFKLPPEFIKAYSESLNMARQAVNQPYTPYTGQLVAGMTPTQQQGLANINASQGMALPFINEGAGYTREAARGITPELYDRFYSPYVRDVANATQANLLESAAQQRSGLKSGAIGAGAFGGDRAGIAQAEMARQQNLANAQAMSNIYNQGYTQAMGLAGGQVQNLGAMGQQLAGLGAGAQSSVLQGAQAQMAAGAQEQATNQAQLQAAYDQFLQGKAYPFQLAQFFANIAQGLGSTAGGTSSTTAPPPNMASQIIGGATAAGNLLSGIGALSDERVKENIEAVGQLNDGQTIYRYNFKGDPKTQIGLLAQEVEAVKPNAVTEAGGLKMVDYRGATDDAANSMGGVVAPGADRQGFMDGGMPYGGSGYIPQNPMMTAASSKIPQAATPSDGSEFDTPANAFGSSKNPNGLFSKPSIYASGGVVGRHGYATDGGVPFMPYSGARGYIPEGKLGGGGDRIAERAPRPFEDTGLAEDWQEIKPLSPEQADNIKGLVGKVRGFFADPDMAAIGYTGQPSAYETYDPVAILDDKYGSPKEIEGRPGFYSFARGGVAGRNGYQFGGEPTMEDAMREAEEQGLAAAPAPARSEAGEFRYPTNQEVEAYIAQSAQKRGIDPNVAVKVWRSEGATGNPREAWQSKIVRKDGTREPSYGPFQLYMEGGLGNEMEKATGLSPSDPRNWQPSVDFALDQAAKGGWGPWAGAKAIGLAPDAGLGDARSVGEYAPGDTRSIQPVSADATGVAGTPQPMSADVEAAPEAPKSRFDLKSLFASENNPSIVEQIIGRRLSPEARSAMLNASFALMAGKSPFFFTNVGEAGKVGTQTYYNAKKQGADLRRQAFEAQTGRMQAEVADKVANKNIYTAMLPQIRFWQMRNPGKPLPEEFQRVIDAAFPPQGPAGLVMAPGAAPALAGGAPASGGSAGAPAPALPADSAAPAADPPVPAGAAPTGDGGGNSVPLQITEDQASILSQLPDEQNPLKILEMAQGASTTEDYLAYINAANDMLSKYKSDGVLLPSGKLVPFPGSTEKRQAEKAADLQVESAQKATSEQTERAQQIVAAYPTSKNTLDQAAETLATTATGQLEDTKAYLSTVLKSLGLTNDAELIEQATGIQKLQKTFSQILFSGGLKDKIGSDIAASELMMFARGFGDVNLEPAVNRFIIGTMRGILEMDAQRSRDWVEFANRPENKGKLFSRSEITDWQIKWSDDNPVTDFVQANIAKTPVAGEVSLDTPEDYFRAGYRYVMPDGKIREYTGDVDEPFVEVE